MSTKAVHWHEGMFLRPHHFQGAQRHLAHLAQRQQKWDVHYNWGVRTLDLDLDALANYRFAVRALQARLRDGSVVSLPEDGEVEPLNLRPAFGRAGSFVVALAVPVLALGQANAAGSPDRPARYLVDTLQAEDENSGTNPKPIQVRRLNLKLVTSLAEPAGYELLPLARVEKSTRAEAIPQLDAGYVPPLLACDAWPGLQVDLLQGVYQRLGKKIDLLAKNVTARGVTFDSSAQGDPLLIHQLRELNEAYTVLHVLAFCPGVHPLQAYLELCRAVGQLAILGDARRAPDLPRYEHDDLARCFGEVKRWIDGLLDRIDEPPYDERAFIGAGYRTQVSLEPAWLEPGRPMYIGVQSPLPTEECLGLVTRGGQLDLKIGASSRVEEIFREGQAGLDFAPVALPPRALPQQPGRFYLQINRGTQEAEWRHVMQTLSLAVRVNEKLLVGNLQGQRAMTVKFGGRTVPLEFSLYVVTP